MAARLTSLGTVRGLSTLLDTLNKVCKVIAKFSPIIRQFVPEDHLTAYDGAISAILAACDVIRAIEYADSLTQTNAPFGGA